MNFDASNTKMVKNRKRREKRAAERKIADTKMVMSTKEGRRFVYGLLADCGVYKSTFTSPNGLILAFNEGSRNVGLKLLAHLQESCLEEFHLAESEAAFYEKEEKQTEEAYQTTVEPEEENPDA